MSRKTTIEYLLDANTAGLVTGFDKARKGVTAFKKASRDGTEVVGALRSQLLGLAGAAVGLHTLGVANQIMLDASAAGYNLEASLQAANRQFEVGSAELWRQNLERLAGELKVYSDTSLKNAAAKTIDMTKRLGMSAEQMEKIIALTGDLSAGKTTLEDGIERVTAALRGEAEASEYLGLTLNETYVKSWYEAQGATQGAWKDLDDLQKAQIRYNVLLEQAEPLAGRAAGSIDTYAGALQLIKTEITNSIAGNEDLIAAMTHVAEVLRENADELSALASSMASGAATIIEFIANNRELLTWLAKWGAVFWAGSKALGVLAGGFRGVNAAMLEMTGVRLLPWFRTLISGAGNARIAVMGLASGFAKVGGALTAFYGAYKAGEWVTMRKQIKAVADETARLGKYRKRLNDEAAKVGERVGMVGATFEDLDRAEKAGELIRDEDNNLIRAPEKKEEQVATTPGTAPAKKTEKTEKKEKTTKETEEISDVFGRLQIEEAVRKAAAKDKKDQPEREIPEWAKDDYDNVFGYHTLEELAAMQPKGPTAGIDTGLADRVDQAWQEIEDGTVSGLDNIASRLQGIYGKHEVALADKSAGQPEKTVRLQFAGGELRGDERSAEALIRNLEEAGMRT